MKLLIITAAALTLGACAYQPPTCGAVEESPVLLTKEGFPIIDDQAPIPFPCPEVPVTGSPDAPYVPPVDDPEPEKVKGNNGWGNGDQDAPGNSEPNNGAENNGGNHNGRDEAPSNSWHDK